MSSLVAEADRMLKARAAYAAAAGVRPPMPGHWETLSPSNSNPALVQATSGETYNPGQGAGTPPAATPSGQGQGQTVPPSYASSWSTDAAGTAGGYGLGVFAQSGQEYPGKLSSPSLSIPFCLLCMASMVSRQRCRMYPRTFMYTHRPRGPVVPGQPRLHGGRQRTPLPVLP